MSLPDYCPWTLKPGRKSLGRSEEDFEYDNRPFCINCGKNKVAISMSDNKMYMRKFCNTCADNKYKKKYRVIINSKSVCEKCGFVPDLDCQLDVDHIDGNSRNNDRSNLVILCANCHRLKTFMNNDSVNIRFRMTEVKGSLV